MPEHRARKHHQDRVAETLREEIGVLIEGELSDPRIDFCYVSEVALNPGGKSARVYVAIDSAVKDVARAEANTIAGLEAAKGYIRHELKERMGKRHVPELSFLADRSGRFQARIDASHEPVAVAQKCRAGLRDSAAATSGGRAASERCAIGACRTGNHRRDRKHRSTSSMNALRQESGIHAPAVASQTGSVPAPGIPTAHPHGKSHRRPLPSRVNWRRT